MNTSSVPNWLEQRARDRAASPALVTPEATLTYSELGQRSMAWAAALQREGVRRGDRVGVLCERGIEFAIVMHALMRLGAVLVPLDRRLHEHELGQRLDDAAVALVVSGDSEVARAARLVHGRSGVASLPLSGLASDRALPPSRLDLDAVHAIVFTSGSSGQAKGVQLTYSNHLWSALGSACNLGVLPNDRWLACLPFCHVGGLAILLRSVIYGTAVVIHDGFDPQRVHHAIDREGITQVSLVATMLTRLLEARAGVPYPPSLRCALMGGGAIPRVLLDECLALRLPAVQTYGMTEAASQITTLAAADAQLKLGSVGRPLLGTEVVLRVDGAEVATGAIGEIHVRGPTLAAGYVNDPRPLVDAEGWFASGDLGRCDEEGYLYVVGRCDDLIITGGENVYPTEVEAVLQAHPAVAEACVAGLEDPQWGRAVTAWVRVHETSPPTVRELQAHVRAHLAGFKVPRRIIFVDDFPRTAAGKIQRRRLVADVGTAESSGSPPTND